MKYRDSNNKNNYSVNSNLNKNRDNINNKKNSSNSKDGNNNIIETIKQQCKCPVVTASQAMIDALRQIGVTKLTLVTPYTDDINLKEKDFLEQNGIEVVSMKGLQIVPAEVLRTQSVETIEKLVVTTDVKEADAVCVNTQYSI